MPEHHYTINLVLHRLFDCIDEPPKLYHLLHVGASELSIILRRLRWKFKLSQERIDWMKYEVPWQGLVR
jgi:hypothetical protein